MFNLNRVRFFGKGGVFRHRRGVLLAIAAFFCLSGAARATDLQMLTEEAPPFSFLRDGKIAGFGTELVEELAKRTGTSITIRILPWARAYKMAQGAEPAGLFMAVRNAERETLFRWVGPVDTSITAFYAKQDAKVHLAGIEDARAARRILVPREWYSHQLLRQLGFSNLNPVNTPEDMARMILNDRAEVMITANLELPILARKVGAKVTDFRMLYPINKVHDYIAFSLGTPEKTILLWQQALDRMKRDGSFAAIYARWFPGQVPPGIKPDPDAVH